MKGREKILCYLYNSGMGEVDLLPGPCQEVQCRFSWNVFHNEEFAQDPLKALEGLVWVGSDGSRCLLHVGGIEDRNWTL